MMILLYTKESYELVGFIALFVITTLNRIRWTKSGRYHTIHSIPPLVRHHQVKESFTSRSLHFIIHLDLIEKSLWEPKRNTHH